MRRLLLLATFVLALAPSVGWAQRSGVRGGGGPARFGFAPRAGTHGFVPAFSRAPRTSIRFGSVAHPSRRGSGHFDRRRSRFFARRSFGYGYPVYYAGYYDPFYWDGYNGSHDSAESDQVLQQELARRVDELDQELQRLREEREYREPAPAPASPPPAPQAKLDPGLPVVFVFLDRRIQEVKNYAIANETVLVFEDHRTRKFPLADLDLAATMKLNDERGVDFQVPSPPAGQ
jgi:hypothetical protein